MVVKTKEMKGKMSVNILNALQPRNRLQHTKSSAGQRATPKHKTTSAFLIKKRQVKTAIVAGELSIDKEAP